ncbi:MAG: OmpA family protein [Saprospiraceae bacterium]|nr:OmpA family protein [Saprospiraceae bacterium]
MKADSLLLTVLVFFSTIVSAQNAKTDTISPSPQRSSTDIKIRKPPSIEGGILLGATAYSGDLELALAETRPMVGVFVRRAFGDYFAVQATLSQGILAGSDAHSTDVSWRMARNIQFKSSITELSLRAELHFLSTQRKISALSSGVSVLDDDTKSPIVRKRTRSISPFIYVGGGGAFLNPKTDFNDSPSPNPITEAPRIAADKTIDFEKVHFVLPIGGGLRLPLVNRRTVITLEGGFRPTFSDYIDGISVAGNPNANDWYFMGSIGLSKILGYTKDSDKDGIVDKLDKCPFLKGDPKLNGCPDRDGDGITDDKDECPTIAGLKNYDGCPDTDGDGIADKFDECPTVSGSGRYKGCPTEKKDSAMAQNTADTVYNQATNPVVQLNDTTKVRSQNDTSTQIPSINPIQTPPQYVSQPTSPETIKPLETDTLKAKIETNTTTSTPIFVNQIQIVDTTTHAIKPIPTKETPQYTAQEPKIKEQPKVAKDSAAVIEKPKTTALPQKETPQYVAEQPKIKEQPKVAKDSAAVIEKPATTASPQKETPQYVAEQPKIKEQSKVAKDSIAVIEKPKTILSPQKETPQYVAEQPKIKEQPKVAKDSASVIEKPATIVSPQKETPQYAATEKPMVKEPTKDSLIATKPIVPTASDTSQNIVEKPTVNVDSLIMAIEKPLKTAPTKSTVDSAARTNVKPPRLIIPQTIPPQMDLDKPVDTVQTVVALDTLIRVDDNQYHTPFPTRRANPYLDAASVSDSTAFNIVRNHYTISPVYFDHSKTIYQAKSLAILDEVAFIMLKNENYRLRIVGHTDGTGSKSSNVILSVNRAKMCYQYLVNKGVPARRITFKGLGQSQPAADNDSDESKQLNRRVEFEIITD